MNQSRRQCFASSAHCHSVRRAVPRLRLPVRIQRPALPQGF
ncbi:hypothetical protein RGUI_3891 [Rhodovulum sp. P5]|nr:hypothetical protein RGUI_3891 [Rhodovulum sp. P5]